MSESIQPSPVQIGAEPKPACRTCSAWKRRDSFVGACFDPGRLTILGHTETEQSDHCPNWTAKVARA